MLSHDHSFILRSLWQLSKLHPLKKATRCGWKLQKILITAGPRDKNVLSNNKINVDVTMVWCENRKVGKKVVKGHILTDADKVHITVWVYTSKVVICVHFIKLCSPRWNSKSHFWPCAGHLSPHLHFRTISAKWLFIGFKEMFCERVQQKVKILKFCITWQS